MDRSEVALARRLDRMPRVAEQVLGCGLSLVSAGRIGVALTKLRRHVDRPGGEIDGQPGEPVLRAVIVDGSRSWSARAAAGWPTTTRSWPP